MNEETIERIIDPTCEGVDNALDLTLRPKFLNEFIGQEKLKANLDITIKAARGRKEPIEHVLLYGPPGLGKTTLAHLIAREMDSNIRVTTGPAIEKSGDLAAILSNLEAGDVLFIDEIHRLNKTIEEILYPAMEDYALDIIIGKGPSARTVRIDLPRFTLIGATTKVSFLSAPLRDRFGVHHHLNFYEADEIEKIVSRSSGILGMEIAPSAAAEIATRARRTPRIANRLLKRARDYAEVQGNGILSEELCRQAFAIMEIDELGLDWVDRQILETIIDKFNGGPVGLNTIAASTGEEMETVEDVYEPYLMQLGFLDRSPRGRVVTDRAYEHLGRKRPNQKKLV
jgi:Holliday junction DNA helicase RuvB